MPTTVAEARALSAAVFLGIQKSCAGRAPPEDASLWWFFRNIHVSANTSTEVTQTLGHLQHERTLRSPLILSPPLSGGLSASLPCVGGNARTSGACFPHT